MNTESGALFRPINKGGTIADFRLSAGAISELVKFYTHKIGLEPRNYSGHSLRAGLATSAAQHGASSWQIRKQTGHASDAMLARYIRDGDIFRDNAAGILF